MNAGVDKVRFPELLVSKNKTVLISTHDPPPGPVGGLRLVIKNDRIFKFLMTTPDEKKHLQSLKKIDCKLTLLWNHLRAREEIDWNDLVV
ncbi:MAG: hypothetical protein Q8J68_00945 [Methanolobus sp.]|uniref:hypothetical protein n=1 Tax=Methanolobus sp. TaxID=1874737 RepID=UPI0027310DB1|nr:hypothetical protein [Methanolobus sp.]MDP2215851.1 hypothetical protein [Methanolobus sp.]